LECADRRQRFDLREPQLALAPPGSSQERELRLAHGKAATAVAALQIELLTITNPGMFGSLAARLTGFSHW